MHEEKARCHILLNDISFLANDCNVYAPTGKKVKEGQKACRIAYVFTAGLSVLDAKARNPVLSLDIAVRFSFVLELMKNVRYGFLFSVNLNVRKKN